MVEEAIHFQLSLWKTPKIYKTKTSNTSNTSESVWSGSVALLWECYLVSFTDTHINNCFLVIFLKNIPLVFSTLQLKLIHYCLVDFADHQLIIFFFISLPRLPTFALPRETAVFCSLLHLLLLLYSLRTKLPSLMFSRLFNIFFPFAPFCFHFVYRFVYFLVWHTKPWKIISTNYICNLHVDTHTYAGMYVCMCVHMLIIKPHKAVYANNLYTYTNI